ncbi:MAG: recombination regulator RecX [Eubacteriales bacterium]|nr:recombination regulator RecX [Eubacteriales bacterium]
MNDLVTSLREERGGYAVTVNETESFRLSRADFRALPLQEGQALHLKQYLHDLLLRQYPEALNRAVKLLAIRERSHAEIERRLINAGYLPDTVEMTLYKLEKESLLDDDAFAHAWAKARSAKRLGKARILQELRQKGVDNAIAQAAVADLDDDAQAEAAVVLASKLLKRNESQTPDVVMRRAVAAMLRRGYTYGEASRALQTALEPAEDE